MGDKFGMGIDDTHMKLRGAPVLDEPALSAHQKMIADKLTVSELMTVAMIALPPIAKVHSPTPEATLLKSMYTTSDEQLNEEGWFQKVPTRNKESLAKQFQTITILNENGGSVGAGISQPGMTCRLDR